jgi:MoaA/NifB/PqqE/SkfB family radical SAM enzyme
MNLQYPQRLNLAIGKRCFVSCRGCYQFFGAQEPNLQAMTDSVRRFVRLGISAVTISGGDPLTIQGLLSFLHGLRTVGATDIKVDTVGTGLTTLTSTPSSFSRQNPSLMQLLRAVDALGVPLDGCSNTSVARFRTGRPNLFDETIRLFTALDRETSTAKVIVNTVAYKGNVEELPGIFDLLLRHRSVFCWNIFQYTPTDQVDETTNHTFALRTEDFARARTRVQAAVQQILGRAIPFTVAFRSVRSRLGEYLLINSDGEAWVPDAKGQTIHIGNLYRGELCLLQAWSEIVRQLRNDSAEQRDFHLTRQNLPMLSPTEGA